MTKQKGQTVISALVGLLIFILLLVIAVLPILSKAINDQSANNVTYLPTYGATVNTIMFLCPLFLALAGLVAVAFTLFRAG